VCSDVQLCAGFVTTQLVTGLSWVSPLWSGDGLKAAFFLAAFSIHTMAPPARLRRMLTRALHHCRRVESTYNLMYCSSAGKEEEDLRAPTVIAVAVMVAPLLLLGAKILLK